MIKTSIARKYVMALTGLFLITFLITHVSVNALTLCSDPEYFNAASHFMGTNIVIQLMQYVLAAGFLIHIILGIMLKYQNEKARPVKYVKENAGSNSSFASRSMIYTGMLILLFLVIHMRDYFYEIKFDDLGGYSSDYELVVNLFSNPIYTAIYVVSFVLLAIHLNHGFQSAFQSLGASHRAYTPWVKKFGIVYSIVVPGLFAIIALFHFINSL
jgi:succinate dehydrogenase / fumarate reductase cytochrome b subunit